MTSFSLNWSALTWPEFVRGVTSYREHFSRQAREDAAYLTCYQLLREDASMVARAGHSREIVTFLNAWACRLDSTKAPNAIQGWIRANATGLEQLERVRLIDQEVPGVADRVDDLYRRLLFEARAQLHNMSDAAASKVLHQLLPDLFVMWDKAIKQAAMAQGFTSYAAFIVGMHDLSKRLLTEANMDVGEAEVHLQAQLRYPLRKTFAKYIDEANWYWAVGRFSALHGGP
jgi:hypothetical protein